MKKKSNPITFAIFIIGLSMILWGCFFNFVHIEIGPITGDVLMSFGLSIEIIAIIVLLVKRIANKVN